MKITNTIIKILRSVIFSIVYNGIGYEWLRGLALDFASTYQTENPRRFSKGGENKQLLIVIVVHSFISYNSIL